MLKKFAILTLILAMLLPQPALAQDGNSVNDADAAVSEGADVADHDLADEEVSWEKRKREIEEKLAEIVDRSATLESQISYLNNQIYLTTLNIQETERRIQGKQTELAELVVDIQDLQERLNRLESSLDHHQEVYEARVSEFYKSNRLSTWELIFGSKNITDAFLKIKYLKVLEKADRKLMEQMSRTVQSYEEQKAILKNKKAQVEDVKAAIEDQKAELESRREQLSNQKAAKDALLKETQSDEQKYQELLSEAKAQLATIRALVLSRGGASLLSDQTVCNDWGCYYNQRDSAWGAYMLGDSEYSVAGYGCLVSSVAMVATHYGYTINPADIAVVHSAFVPGWGYLYFGTSANSIAVGEVQFYRQVTSLAALNEGPLVARLSLPEGTHFIVIKEKTENGDYLIHDPWYEGAHDVLLSDYYSVGDISRVDRVSFQ